MNTSSLTYEQLENRLTALHQASMDLVRFASLSDLLERVAAMACSQVNSHLVAVGVLSSDNDLDYFISTGMCTGESLRVTEKPHQGDLLDVLMRSKEVIRVRDISKDSLYSGLPGYKTEMTSVLSVPILLSDHMLGKICLINKAKGDEFTPDDQQIIETLAGYSAVAISNALLYQQIIERDRILMRRNQNLALLNDIASTLATSVDIDQILEKALNQVMDFLQVDVGEIFLRHEDNNVLKLVLHRGEGIDHLWAQQEFIIGNGTIGKAALEKRPVLVMVDDFNNVELSSEVVKENWHQIACFSLHGQHGATGVLCIATDEHRPLDELDIQFLSAIGSWVGTAIENIRLNLQQRRIAVLEERERIGMDLHDGTIQSIYAVGLTLEHVRLVMDEDVDQARSRIDQAIKDLDSSIRDIRAYILDLRPRQLHDENLLQGIQRLISEFRANTLIEVSLHGNPGELSSLPRAQAVALFHICQETLANIAKHAHASHVEVSLWTTNERALLEVSDDGVGFDLNEVKFTLGHGLSNMQTRARNAGGEVEIISETNEGSTILVWVPFYAVEIDGEEKE